MIDGSFALHWLRRQGGPPVLECGRSAQLPAAGTAPTSLRACESPGQPLDCLQVSRILPFAAVIAAVFAASCAPKAIVLTDGVQPAKVQTADGKWVKNQPAPQEAAVAAKPEAGAEASAPPVRQPWFNSRNSMTGDPGMRLAPTLAVAPAAPAPAKKSWFSPRNSVTGEPVPKPAAEAPAVAQTPPAPAKKPWFSPRNSVSGEPVTKPAAAAPAVAKTPPAAAPPAVAQTPPPAEKKHWWQKSGDSSGATTPALAGRKSGGFRKKVGEPAAADQAVAQTPPAPQKKGWSLFHPKAQVIPENQVAQNPPVKEKKTAPQKSGSEVAESAPPLPRGKGPALADDKIRVPEMLNLPGEGEFRSTNPTAPKDPNGNAVISRPPTDPPSRVKPEEKKD